MRRILALAALALVVPLIHAQEKPAPVRVCVATLENTSRHTVTPTLQRDELVRALQRSNKSKEVKKGKASKIETVALESRGEPDSAVREKNCEYVLYTDLTEVLRIDRPGISAPPAGAVEAGTAIGDSRAYPEDYHSATVDYRLVRAGDVKPWTSGLVSAREQLSEDLLVTQLMDQIANRVAAEIRKPHPSAPE